MNDSLQVDILQTGLCVVYVILIAPNVINVNHTNPSTIYIKSPQNVQFPQLNQ